MNPWLAFVVGFVAGGALMAFGANLVAQGAVRAMAVADVNKEIAKIKTDAIDEVKTWRKDLGAELAAIAEKARAKF